MKTFLEFIPLLAFFVAYKTVGILPATAVLVALTVLQVVYLYIKERKVAMLPLASAILVAVFGLLTLLSADPVFLKMKPTVLYSLFGVVLILGVLIFKRGLLGFILGNAMEMPEFAWKTLSLRWGFFFLALAVLNEIIWRSVSTDSWVNFKVFGFIPLLLVFTLTQAPFIMRHAKEKKK